MSRAALAAAAAALATGCSLGHFDDQRDRAWADSSDQPDGVDASDYPIALAVMTTERPGLHAVAVGARPPGLGTISYDLDGSLEYRGVAIAEVSGVALETLRPTIVAPTAPVAGGDGSVVVGGLGDRGALLVYDARTGLLGPQLRRVIEASACGPDLSDLGRHMVWTTTNLGSAADPDLIVSAGGELLAFPDLRPDATATTCLRCAVEVGGAARTITAMIAADFDAATAGDEIAIGLADPDGAAAGSVTILHASLIELHDSMGAACFRQQSPMVSLPAEASTQLDFGAALAAGNSNERVTPELAVAVPSQSRVYVVPDLGTSGPSGPPRTIVGIAAAAGFGTGLAFGDLDGDDLDELAIADPDTSVNNVPAAGSVWVYAPSDDTGTLEYELATRLHDTHPASDQAVGRSIAAGEFVGSVDDTDLLLVGAAGELFVYFRALVASTDPRE